MDKILFIDLQNQIWRAFVKFAPHVKHERCFLNTNCDHVDNNAHCQCGSPWSIDPPFCYGDKYSIVFNFFRNLRPIIEDFTPDKCFLILEGHPQFRYDLYADYKANRIIKVASRSDNQLKINEAKTIILALLPHLPLTLAKADKYEADDTIASLCDNMREEDLSVVSSDSDFIQLLQRGYKNIRVYNPIKKMDMEAPAYPYVAWKCLAGDKSDNIPNLLGPKKAIATASDPNLLQKFLQLEENRANFSINRQLIEFRSIPMEEISLQEGQRNWQFLYDAFRQMKFESIIRDPTWKRYINTFECIKY